MNSITLFVCGPPSADKKFNKFKKSTYFVFRSSTVSLADDVLVWPAMQVLTP